VKKTRLTTIALAALALGLVAWVILWLVTEDSQPKKLPAAKDDRLCPECKNPVPPGLLQTGGECPYCEAKGKSVRVGKGSQETSVWRGPGIPIALGITLALLLVVHAFFLVRQRVAASKIEEDVYIVYCRKCSRRLRYRESQGGQIAKCPICRAVVLFPKIDSTPRPRWPARLLGKLLRR